MTSTTPEITVNAEIPYGTLHGYNENGFLIVIIRDVPTYERIMGSDADDADVVRWEASPDEARRIAALAAWHETGLPCGGSA